MNAKENAHPTVGAVEQAQVGSILADGNSRDYFTSNPVAGQVRIADLLSPGRENAVPLRHLVKLTERDGRTVRLMIERERRSGALIVSDNQNGYWMADDPAEAKMFAHSMRHRAGEIIRTAQAIEVEAGID